MSLNINHKCRFCKAGKSLQKIKGKHVYGGTKKQKFYECQNCYMIYLFPTMEKKEEDRFYKKNFEKFMHKRSSSDMEWLNAELHVKSNQREVKRRMPFLIPHLKKGAKILEVGCSSGFMLYELKKYGCSVYGLDPSGQFIDYLNSKKIKCFKQFNQLSKQKIKFDLILHYYVLEHVRNPISFLKNYISLLKNKGLMIFEVPNASDPLIELYNNKKFHRFYWSVVHHWYFNKNSISKLLQKIKFKYKIFPEQRYDLSNHLVWLNEGKPGGYGKYSNIFSKKLDKTYKEDLKNNWFCDTLKIKIKKNK